MSYRLSPDRLLSMNGLLVILRFAKRKRVLAPKKSQIARNKPLGILIGLGNS
ncbi:hypothetical protein [Richelia intracellularis]|uniref:hypothetical protein n=1 Tax=Richelia intracellularis TaxID=1164990 RepID=UPI0012DF9E5D|nr:hypothetical protein [Richelia intracellularis]